MGLSGGSVPPNGSSSVGRNSVVSRARKSSGELQRRREGEEPAVLMCEEGAAGGGNVRQKSRLAANEITLMERGKRERGGRESEREEIKSWPE